MYCTKENKKQNKFHETKQSIFIFLFFLMKIRFYHL